MVFLKVNVFIIMCNEFKQQLSKKKHKRSRLWSRLHLNAALTLFSNTFLESKNKKILIVVVAPSPFICQNKTTILQRDT